MLIPTRFTGFICTSVLFLYGLGKKKKKQTQLHVLLEESLLKSFVSKNGILKN